MQKGTTSEDPLMYVLACSSAAICSCTAHAGIESKAQSAPDMRPSRIPFILKRHPDKCSE